MRRRIFLPLLLTFLWSHPGALDAAPQASQAPRAPQVKAAPKLALTRNVMIIQLKKGFYEIREGFVFENLGSEPIVSRGGAPTLRFVLPKSSNIRDPAAELTAPVQGLDPKFLRFQGAEILSTEPIPPGVKQVFLFYRLADEFGGIMVERPTVYGSSSFAVLPEKDRVQMGQMEGGTLVRGEPAKFQDSEYETFFGPTRPGASVRFMLKAPDSGGGVFYFASAAGAVLILGAVFTFWIRGRRRGALALQGEREEILRAIASLDDRLAGGGISPDEHRTQRGPRFERLRGLSR